MSTKTTGPRRRGLRSPLPHLSPRGGAALALFVAACFVGPSTIASKAALDHTPPLTLAFTRFAIALAVLLLLCRRSGVRPEFGRAPALLGVTGVALAFICQNLGLRSTSAANATLIIEGTIPIATALLGTRLLGEDLAGRRLVGLLFAVAGVAAVVLQGTDGGFSAAGSLLSLATAVSFAVYTVIGRRTYDGGVSLSVVTGSIAVGVILLAPCAAAEVAFTGLEPRRRAMVCCCSFWACADRRSPNTFGRWGWSICKRPKLRSSAHSCLLSASARQPSSSATRSPSRRWAERCSLAAGCS